MEKFTKAFNTSLQTKLNRQINKISKILEGILDEDIDQDFAEIERQQAVFEAIRDRNALLGISEGLPLDHLMKVACVFSKLSLFFEAGVLLENNDNTWKAQAEFFKGHTRSIKISPRPVIPIPNTNCLTVVRAPARPVLKKLKLERLDLQNKSQALLIKPTHDFAFLLLSELPDLWLIQQAETLTTALNNCFSP